METDDERAIEINGISKLHGRGEILHSISFTARPGRVTAFLGPNGAGKSSTLRILLGLDRATSGTATFGGVSYSELDPPLLTVGAVFDRIGGAKSRKIKTHLRMIAESNRIPSRRVSEVLSVVGLADKASARLGTLSLGEGQRLGLASALMGDPKYLVLDEPTNGLDPIGIRWFREFARDQARLGKTVLLSSHLLAEVELIADDIVVINQGSVVAAGSISEVRRHLRSIEEVFFRLTDGGGFS